MAKHYSKKDIKAIHINKTGEISGITEKGSPISADLLIIEDSADSNNKKKVQIGNLPAESDANAIHNNTAGEIVAITEKTSLIGNDEFIIEDSADSNNKKSIKASALDLSVMNNTTSSFTSDHGSLTGLTDADHPASAITTATNNFDGILSGADTTVQAALNTIDSHIITSFISGLIEAPAEQDYIVLRDAPFKGNITKITTKSSSGTCTLTGFIGATDLGGTANSVSTSEQSQAHASDNEFNIGDDIKLTVTSNSSCEDLEFTIYYTRGL